MNETVRKLLVTLSQEIQSMTRADLTHVWAMFSATFKCRQDALQSADSALFVIGDRVNFRGRHDQRLVGTVEKVNRKTVCVRLDQTDTTIPTVFAPRWRVLPNLLTHELNILDKMAQV